jgi:Uma2 family endonuclease
MLIFVQKKRNNDNSNKRAIDGVKEYWIVNPRKKIIEQYILDDETETYELLKKVTVGDWVESRVMHGFRIPVAAIFDVDVNRETLKKIVSGSL